MKLVKGGKNNGSFIEMYRNWAGYGYGIMLVYIENNKCEYVMFYRDNSYKRVVINDELLEIYNRG